MDLAGCRFIAVEGPIGAGKTTLASRIADHLDAERLFEHPADNPFLDRFYSDMSRYALATQLNFLFQRVDQLRGVLQEDLFRRTIVADFLLDKDPLFARLTLPDAEYALYRKVYDQLRPPSAAPDLVVYLQAPVDTLQERVRRRGVDFEQRVSPAYLARVAEAYSRFFYSYDDAPLLIVNSERLDFVADKSHFKLLLERIASMRGAREFFNLAA